MFDARHEYSLPSALGLRVPMGTKMLQRRQLKALGWSRLSLEPEPELEPERQLKALGWSRLPIVSCTDSPSSATSRSP